MTTKYFAGFIMLLLMIAIMVSGGYSVSIAQDGASDTITTITVDDIVVMDPSSKDSAPRPYSAEAVVTEESGKSCKTINFEGVGNLSPIPEFDGIVSPDWLGIIDADAGGSGNFAYEPSPSTIAFWLGGESSTRSIQFAEAVAEVTFFYASSVQIQLEALDGNGTKLAQASGPANWNQGPGGDPNGSYNQWDEITVKIDGNYIKSVKVVGEQDRTGIDDLKVCKKIGIHSVEFTQAIQEWQTLDEFKADIAGDKTPPVPIIASKPLALRVYMEKVEKSTQVTVKLSGVAASERTQTIQPNCTTEDTRSQRNGCRSVDFYFTPPAGDWTATLKTYDKDGNEIESHDFALTSVETEVLTLRAVSVCDAKDAEGNWLCAQASTLGSLVDFLERTAPTHDVEVTYPGSSVSRDSVEYTSNTQRWWVDIARDINDLGSEDYYYGMARPNAPSSIGGIAHDIPARGAASRTSAVRLDTETNDEVVAHETGHMLGRRHTNTDEPSATSFPGCYAMATDSDTDWQYANNRIQSGPEADPRLEVGFDVSSESVIDPQNTYDWMSYCTPRWISPHTYRHALNALRITTMAANQQQLFVTGRFWRVSGLIENGGAILDPLFAYETTASAEAGVGSYSIETHAPGGSVLFTRHFTPTEIHTESSGPGDDFAILVFSELIPVQDSAGRIVVIDPNGAEIGAISLAGGAPTVNIVTPSAGVTLSGTQTIQWQITDPDSNAHTSWVQYSPDNGSTWRTLATALPESELSIDWDQVGGSVGQGRVRVFVSDGINSTVATSGAFSVPKKELSASILSPANGAAFRKGDLVHLKGDTYDPEDGASATVAWTSSIDGGLGSDKQLPLVTLSDGEHEITFNAQDSDGNTASDAINVIIDSILPTLTLTVTLDGSPASCVDVQIAAQDHGPGSGLSAVEYSLDGGETWTPAMLDQLPVAFRVAGTGFFHVIARSEDRAGNTAVADERFFVETACPNQLPQADAGNGYNGAEGSPIVLDAAASNDPDGSIILYQWDLDNDSEYDDAIGITTSVVFNDDGLYTVGVKVTDDNSAATTAVAQVAVENVAPTVEAGPDVTTTQGVTFGLTAIVYADAGSVDTHSAQIDWADGITDVLPANHGSLMAVHSYALTGAYTAEVCVTDDEGGVGCDSTAVYVLNTPVSGLAAVNSVPTELGSATRFTATITGGANVNYAWVFGDGSVGSGANASHTYAAVGVYTATVTASNGSGSVSASTVVRVVDRAVAGLTLSHSGPATIGALAHFTATATDGTNVVFTWDFGEDANAADVGRVATASGKASHTYTAPGDYIVMVTATNGRGSKSQTTAIAVKDVAITGLSAQNSSPTKLGAATVFTAAIAGGTNVSYSWNFGDGGVGTGSVASHTYVLAGAYTATVMAANTAGQVVAITHVTVAPTTGDDVAISGLTIDGPTHLKTGETGAFQAIIGQGTNVVYSWDWGDGESSSGPTANHVYKTPGDYTVKVTATNSQGSSEAVATVIVRSIAYLPVITR